MARTGPRFVSHKDGGDALAVAPDGRAAGLIWEMGEPAYFRVCLAPDRRTT